jgi:predicted Rossmann fold flavoprotein
MPPRVDAGTQFPVAVAGGGAAGFFAAITCAEANPAAAVTLYEATAHPLAKVRVSGGGRCNATHACFEPRELVGHYPRGGRELLGPFHRFGPRETIAWFAERGVDLKTEADGRMFPTTDDSATILGCLQAAAARAGVRVVTRVGVASAERAPTGFAVRLTGGETVPARRLLLATGGNRGSAGLTIAGALGHTIVPPVPSLFTFHCDDARLRGIEGVVAPDATVAVPGTRWRARGPVLVTHWGLSGPAILKLSAWAARDLHAADYRFPLAVNWAGAATGPEVMSALVAERSTHPRRQVATANPFGLPARLWERLVAAAGLAADAQWASVSNAALRALAAQTGSAELAVSGKSMNKEEFVTCGGIALPEVDFATMESRLCPGLHFAGEVLDVDGVTGGFNFQAAWTTGWHAGHALARG